MMNPKLTPEMRAALEQNPGQPLEIRDEETQRVYVIVERDAAAELSHRWLFGELQLGFDAAARGDVAAWDPVAVKAAARNRLAQRD